MWTEATVNLKYLDISSRFRGGKFHTLLPLSSPRNRGKVEGAFLFRLEKADICVHHYTVSYLVFLIVLLNEK